MGMPGKGGGGGFMPNPLTGLPRNATPGMPIPQMGNSGQGAPINSAPPAGTGIGPPGMAYAGGNNTFNERMGPPPTDSGTMPPPMMGGNGMDQGGANMIGSMLKRWNGTSGTVPNPITPPPPQTMGYTPPNANIGQPPPSDAPPVGVPGMAPGNFTGQNTTGNSRDAINAALFSGNQAGLQGAGSQATNSAVNAQGAGGGNGWRPGDVSVAGSQAGLNTPAPFAQAGYAAQGLGSMVNGQWQWTPKGLAQMRANSGQV